MSWKGALCYLLLFTVAFGDVTRYCTLSLSFFPAKKAVRSQMRRSGTQRHVVIPKCIFEFERIALLVLYIQYNVRTTASGLFVHALLRVCARFSSRCSLHHR
jgi:hypothetical protein